ncbi:TetR/AcrR family transcriptional regulator [Bosea sp. BIWAKO-01]|uniref:TetR/AcrR family transcriptional regulator n=1 Tax=Bosea sp. BIWAKO-01 TaxID=506668 RepID=UPI000853E70A|nr:TetR/AcrR family transcriptional regulator [Bosea sp. BIWAKO-01]GAU85562.1 transcriptional regulator of TetR family [Bosea sp. BIWAKO-01]
MRTEPTNQRPAEETGQVDMRERLLATASDLFYRRGVRAVGVDVIIEAAGVAKTSLYRHFRTKDDLIAAYLQREDADFWALWDSVAARHSGDGEAELDAHMGWIGERVGRPHYRGCPQINVAAEFPDEDHPARLVARTHKQQLYDRLQGITERLRVKHPDVLATQLSVLINGAFVSSQILSSCDATAILRQMTHALITAARHAPARAA